MTKKTEEKMVSVIYLGPSPSVNVAPYGPHDKDAVFDYPESIAKNLVEKSKRQRFELAKGKK
jgi:hypothetical protein